MMTLFKPTIFLTTCLVSQAALSQPVNTDLSNEISRHETAATAPLIERTQFLKTANIIDARLSPDGKTIAYRLREGLNQHLYLLDTATLESVLQLDSPALVDITWADDSSLLYLELNNAIGYLPVTDSAPSGYFVARDYTSDNVYLGPDHTDARGILVMTMNADNEFLLERYFRNGEHETVLRSTTGERISQARFTPDGETLFVRMETASGYRFYQYRNDKRQLIYSCPLISNAANCQMLSYDEETNTLWLTGNSDSNFANLVAYSVEQETSSIFHSDPDAITDLSGWAIQQDKPVVARYANGLASNYGLNENIRSHLDYLTTQFPQTNITPAIGTNGVWLLEESGALLRHARYYLYHADTQQVTPILEEQRNTVAALLPAHLSRKIPLSYRARDGMLIHGYVSLPKGVDLAQAPFIAMPHPGPNGRVISNYYAETQFLVNRGYIVFEPNFRMSTGYGIDYIVKANRELGNSPLQQDIVDGIDNLLAQGIGDPDRLGIYGFSFGGYATLTGLAYTPDLFRAGVSFAGAGADFGAIMAYQVNRPNFRISRPMAYPQSRLTIMDVDDPRDRERLYQLSPRASIDTFSAPLLLLQGGNDPAAPVELATDFVLAMVNQQKTITYFFDKDMGHGNWPEFETSAYFAMMESFFAFYLGGRKQIVEDSALNEYIQNNLLIDTNNEFSMEVVQ